MTLYRHLDLLDIRDDCVWPMIQVHMSEILTLASRCDKVVQGAAYIHNFYFSVLGICIYNHYLPTPSAASDPRHRGQHHRTDSQAAPTQT